MSKNYKYKEYKEKDSQDKDRLTKVEKKSIEGSNRQRIKQFIKSELEEIDDEPDFSWDNELKMSSLCYKAERLSTEKGLDFSCTCPNPENEKLSSDHISYLNEYIIKLINGE